MRPHQRDVLPCRQCGNQVVLPTAQMKRDYNVTVSCPHCRAVDLAANIMGQAIYNRLKERGHSDLKPFTPQPIDPVRIISGKDGFETIIRRNKKGGERLYSRRMRKPRIPK
jgi:hypothetical protein